MHGLGLGRALRDAVRERWARPLADGGRADALEQRRHVAGVGARQDQRELVAADPGRVVTEAQDVEETGGEGADRGVTAGVAFGVVDLLEVVEIDDHEGERPLVAHAAGDRHLEEAVEAAAVEQAGEPVVPGVVAQHLHPQRHRTEAGDERGVDAAGPQRRVGVEAGGGVEQCLATRVVEGLAAGAEDLAAHPGLLDDDGGVGELVLGHQCIERVVDDRQAALIGRQLVDDRRAEIAHLAHPGHRVGLVRCQEMPNGMRLGRVRQQRGEAAPQSALTCHSLPPDRRPIAIPAAPRPLPDPWSPSGRLFRLSTRATRSRPGCHRADRTGVSSRPHSPGFVGTVCDAATPRSRRRPGRAPP